MSADIHSTLGDTRDPYRGAIAQSDRVAAETLIRSNVLALANGASIRDIDEIVRRNASRMSHEDIAAGRLSTTVLGDIIGAVEQAKGNTAINWISATPDQVRAYLTNNGFKFSDHGPRGLVLSIGDRESPSTGRDGSSASFNVKFGDINEHNFASSSFHSMGLSYGTFASLRAQGFNETNIMHAAQDTKLNGFDVNNPRMSKAFAVLDKEDGKRRDERNQVLADYRERLRHDEEFQRLKAEREKSTNDQDRARLGAQMHLRAQEIRKEAPLEDHIQRAPTANSRKELNNVAHDTVEVEGNINTLSNGNKADAKATTDTINKFRMNPGDANARKNYEALKRAAQDDPAKKQAMAAIDARLEKQGKQVKEKRGSNEVKVAANTAETVKGDAGLDFLNDGDTKAPAKATGVSVPDKAKGSEPAKAAAKETPKTQEKSEKTKVAAAKPAAPKV